LQYSNDKEIINSPSIDFFWLNYFQQVQFGCDVVGRRGDRRRGRRLVDPRSPDASHGIPRFGPHAPPGARALPQASAAPAVGAGRPLRQFQRGQNFAQLQNSLAGTRPADLVAARNKAQFHR
jgi:hypothetical protein